MEIKDDNAIIAAWIQYNYNMDKSILWANRYLRRACYYDPEKAWQLILKILKFDDSDKIITSLAAGPVEDLLSKHGKDFIKRVKKEAEVNEKFNFLLGGVWQNAMDDDIWSEIQKIRKEVW